VPRGFKSILARGLVNALMGRYPGKGRRNKPRKADSLRSLPESWLVPLPPDKRWKPAPGTICISAAQVKAEKERRDKLNKAPNSFNPD
jgi:hypothetical protein